MALKGRRPEQPQVLGESPEPLEPPSDAEPGQPARVAFYKASLQTKCKVSTWLYEEYHGYRGLFRTIAEEFSLLRRDALDLVLFILVRWLNTQQLQLQQQYVEHFHGVHQEQLEQSLHEGGSLQQI